MTTLRSSKLVGWFMPIVPGFDRATLAVRLGHERGSCLRRRQGRCPDVHGCADCAYAPPSHAGDRRS